LEYHCDSNKILVNNASFNSQFGIFLDDECDINTIAGNNASYNEEFGIRLYDNCNNNNITDNIVNNNHKSGIQFILGCDGNIVSGNTVNNNSENGIFLFYGTDNNEIFENNAIYNGRNGIILWDDISDCVVSNNNARNNNKNGIFLFDVRNCNVSNNIATFNEISGINFTDCYVEDIDHIDIEGNTIMNNGIGISMDKSNNTEIKYNLIQENSRGIFIVDSDSNLIFGNALIKNGLHANDNGIGNQWNNAICGNYWDNHTLDDSNHDGITDSVYNSIAGNLAVDTLPLWQSSIHLGGKIHIDGINASAPNWSRTALLTKWCSGSGSFSDPYVLSNLEIDANYTGSGMLISNSKKEYATIENCIILNANDSENDAGIRVENSNNLTIIDNTCLNNADNGILFGAGCTKNLIINNHIEGISTKVGISLAENCNNNTIFNNTVFSTGVDTTGIGIFLFVNCYFNEVLENSVINNFGIGISLSDRCSNNTISQNIVISNGLHGIALVGQCNDNDILANEVIQNALNGIFLVDECDYNTISGNTANENENGIFLQTNCTYNTISGNTADKNRQNGIYLNGWCDDNMIMFNTESFNENGFCGILLEDSYRNEIFNNNAHRNDYGIGLINSYQNIISYNKLWSNREGWRYCDSDCIKGNTFLNNEIYAPGEVLPPDYIGIIIIIIIISSLVIAIGGVYAYKRKHKTIKVQSKVDPDKITQKAITNEQTIGAKKQKQKLHDTSPINLDLTEIEKKEIEQTESELGIEKSEFICIVHKGTIDGAVYICPNCKTFYCVRCANVLKDKGEKCWSCESDINVTITDNIISEKQQKIQELQSRMDSIKITVQTLDESFYSGAISEEIYSQSRDPLMKKITALIQEIEQLKRNNKY